MKKLLLFITIYLSMMLPSYAVSWGELGEFDLLRPMDRGGRISDYMMEIVHAKGMNPISGDCMSACTMKFGSVHYCIMPDVVGWFHPASFRNDYDDNPWRLMDKTGTQGMAAMYPPKLREYAAKHGFWNDPNFKQLNYTQLVALGVRPCSKTTK